MLIMTRTSCHWARNIDFSDLPCSGSWYQNHASVRLRVCGTLLQAQQPQTWYRTFSQNHVSVNFNIWISTRVGKTITCLTMTRLRRHLTSQSCIHVRISSWIWLRSTSSQDDWTKNPAQSSLGPASHFKWVKRHSHHVGWVEDLIPLKHIRLRIGGQPHRQKAGVSFLLDSAALLSVAS